MSDRDLLFGSWLERTRELQKNAYGVDPQSLTGNERAEYFTAMCHAAHTELGEMSAEIGHKRWGSDREINRENYLKEAVDVLHFLVNMILIAGVTDKELNTAYLAKMRVNERRMASGSYTGRRVNGEERDD